MPITPTILLKIILSLPHVTNSAFIKALLHAMYVLAFSAFLRVGEITKTGKLNQRFLLVKHINFTACPNQENSIELTIPHCKHSIRPTSLQISRNLENPLLCPVRAVQYFMQIRKHTSPNEALFSFMDGNPVSRQFFYRKSTKFPCFLRIRHKAIPISQFSHRSSNCCSRSRGF